jgi:ubiquinone/menaquinone biosynthesis C-methylase UbiE
VRGAPPPAEDRSTRGLQARWERAYQKENLQDVHWYQDQVPEHLVDLVEGGRLPEGLVLDLGCGPGISTARLAQARPTVGLDIARAGLTHARRLAAERGVSPLWVVAASPHLPFRDSSFGFVFERGMMQQLPEDTQGDHLREVARVLRSGGLLQYIGRSEAGERLEALCPAPLRLESIEAFEGPMRQSGTPRPMTHALLRRV